MKFNISLSVAGVILLYVADSLCQLNECGQAPPKDKDRIVGGQDAMEGAWPWQVSIHVKDSHHRCGLHHCCGGTLITKDWVLSAAHCFENISLSDIEMYFGRLKQSGSNPHETYRKASKILIHPNHDSNTLDNDIALIQIASSVDFSYSIRPVCLAAANSTFAAGTESWVTGWGTLQSEGTNFPDVLQEAKIPIVSNSDCNNAYGGTITNNMICAGLLNEGGKDACQGDSGGPMVNWNGSRWIQSGIVSAGKDCAKVQYPGVYTRVSQYQEWIYNAISNSNCRSVPNLFLFPISLTFSLIPFTFSLFLSS